MDRDPRLSSQPPTRLQWLALTLPLAPLALFAYGAFEWLFFVTKPSAVSVLPWTERFSVLLLATLPFMPWVMLMQIVASALSMMLFPRLRGLAVVPAAAILAALILILGDNFLYALFRVSAVSGASIARILYGAILLGGFVLWLWKLGTDLWRLPSPRRTTVVLWLAAAPLLILTAVHLATSSVSSLPALPRIEASNRKNVLILSIDGVDAARLSAYGAGGPGNTPFLSSLSEESLFCENAFSDAAQTYGSLTSLLSGRSPLTTKVIIPPSMLRGDDASLHLPAILNRSGYRTLQLSMRHFADADDANLLGGFDRANYRWENRLSNRLAEHSYDSARVFRLAAIDRLDARLARIFGSRAVANDFAQVTGEATDPFWSDARRIETLLAFVDEEVSPWFAHVHFLDTHAGGDREQRVGYQGRSDYDQALLNADRHVRLITEALARRGQLDETILVITSDHGAGWSTTARIPLLIRFPGGANARRVSRNVSNIDIAPTVLEALGAVPPRWMEGTSLLRESVAERGGVIVAVAASGPPRTEGWFSMAVPRAPNYGARALSAVIGSTWYTVDLGSGALTTGAVEAHTRPVPAVAPSDGRRLLEREARQAGFEVPPESGPRPREVQHPRP